MKILREIRDKDVGLSGEERYRKPYFLRKTARAIIFDREGRISLQFLNKQGFHELPGGGLQKGETVEEALKRECLEEAGCKVEIISEIGASIEYRNRFNSIQISYCYMVRVAGEIGRPKYEKKEIRDGMTPLWTPIEKAIALIEKDQPSDYRGKFIRTRDLAFLREALRTRRRQRR